MKDDKEFKVGAAGVGDGPYNTALLTANALGVKKIRMIPNYGGGDEIYGIMRKEIEGVVGTMESFGSLIEQGLATPLVIYDLKRWSRLPQVPTLSELVKTEKGKAVATYLSSEGELVRAIYTSPNVPADITQTLRTALMRAVQNEDFKKTIVQMKMEPFDFVPGEEVGKIVAASLNMPPEVANIIKEVAKGQ
jgi:tripartite-type tricarboxylate transporter receptor subunit TctC